MKHWNPDEAIVRRRPLPAPVRQRRALPAGAKAGLALVAAACIGVALLAWQVASPRDLFH